MSYSSLCQCTGALTPQQQADVQTLIPEAKREILVIVAGVGGGAVLAGWKGAFLGLVAAAVLNHVVPVPAEVREAGERLRASGF